MLSGRVFSVWFSLTLVVIALVVPGAAVGQTSSDPTAGSPPAAVYQIPLEGGRRDAAPRKREAGNRLRDSVVGPAGEGGSPGGSGGSPSTSVYRTENNFGSSSQVPGAAQVRADGPGAVSGGEGTAGEAAGAIPASRQILDEGETSVPATLGLLALIAMAGVGVGVIALRAARRGW